MAQGDFNQLAALDKQIKSFNVGPNPYTWFTMEALDETWKSLQRIIKERDDELVRERERQEDNDKLRKQFAQAANAFHQWLTDARYVCYYYSCLTCACYTINSAWKAKFFWVQIHT